MDDLDQLKSGTYTTPGGAYGEVGNHKAEERKDDRLEARREARMRRLEARVARINPGAVSVDDQRAADALRDAKGTASPDIIPLGPPPAPPEPYVPLQTPPIQSDPAGGDGEDAGVGTTCIVVVWSGGSATAKTATVSLSDISDFTG